MKMARTNSLEAAHQYLKSGWWPVPIPPGQKGPALKGWTNLRLTDDDLSQYFGNGEGIGLLLGEPSGGLVDVDLDASEAIVVTPMFLPETGMVHGRPSKLRSHWWYLASPIPATLKFQDPDGTMLVELRSTGGQTVIPPSVHPSGELISWESDGEPRRIDGPMLRAAVARVAACALLARHWPTKGSRHEASLATAGLLLRGGTSREEAEQIVEAASRAVGDEEWRDRVQSVRDTAATLASGQSATGGPSLASFIGEPVVAKLREWLNLKTSRTSETGPYRVEGGRICREKFTRDGAIVEPLCNFTATVTEEIILDDGVEPTWAFLVEGCLETGEHLPSVRISANRFAGMGWVTEAWGLRAVVRAGSTTRDYLREAIQRLSPHAQRRQVFTHTGWREVNGRRIYLTATGAVGQEGFEVDLGSPDLTRYALPREAEGPSEAMRLSLQLLRLAPLSITAPLWATVFRAPLASIFRPDFSLWLEGPTASLKSTLAALFLSHFGDFDRVHLPGAWSSTANQLRRRAFILKDVPFVIDDYAPTALDARELEAKVSRLIRAQGNLVGRGRLRSDLSERPAFPPRGLIISTGEQHPPGQSLLARMLVVQMERSHVDLADLTQVQKNVTRFSHAMAGYVAWLAPQMPTLPALLRQTFEGARARATAEGWHLRVPETLAHLWCGLHAGLTYAEEVGACSLTEAEDLRGACWEALLAIGRAQAQVVEEERPSRLFLQVLLTLVTQGRGLLLPKDAGPDRLRAEQLLIGWQDEEAIYLIPEAAFVAVNRFCRESGEGFPLRQEGLRRDLAREGLSDCDAGRHTAMVRVGGHPRRVLKLRRAAVESLLGEAFSPPLPLVTSVTGSQE